MPHKWRFSTVIPLYKNKHDIQDCNNYRSIKLLGHTMKLRERVIKGGLRRDVRISKNQFGFMIVRTTMEAVHLLQRLMGFCSDKEKGSSHGVC